MTKILYERCVLCISYIHISISNFANSTYRKYKSPIQKVLYCALRTRCMAKWWVGTYRMYTRSRSAKYIRSFSRGPLGNVIYGYRMKTNGGRTNSRSVILVCGLYAAPSYACYYVFIRTMYSYTHTCWIKS